MVATTWGSTTLLLERPSKKGGHSFGYVQGEKEEKWRKRQKLEMKRTFHLTGKKGMKVTPLEVFQEK